MRAAHTSPFFPSVTLLLLECKEHNDPETSRLHLFLIPPSDHLGVCNDLKCTQSTLILHFPYNYNLNGVDIMHKTFINGCLKKVSNGVVETIFETFFFFLPMPHFPFLRFLRLDDKERF